MKLRQSPDENERPLVRRDPGLHLALLQSKAESFLFLQVWRALLQTMRGFFDVLQSSVKHSRQRMYLVPPVFSQLTEQHQAVIDAIFAGDADGARKAMMAHLSFVHTTMKRFDEDQARHARITRLPGDHNEHSREKNA
ncbi:FCD domain-containing protein [Escherichia coli]|uniref:FCD domain-containing protein n=1 Tax=Escherichia coli TaxID=562 RepID=UPI0032DA72EF